VGRKAKRLWTNNKGGDGIRYLECLNEHEEAYFVASEIKRLCREQNRSYKDFAVLYRINAMSRVIEDELMREGISYKIFGGLRFYDRKEIKDVIAYLRVIQNPSDNISLKRIINEPKRGIGNATIDTAERLANERGVSIFSIISSAAEIPELARASSKLEKFVSLINSLRAQSMVMTASEMIEEVLERTGILEAYRQENTLEAQSRIENIKELLSVAIEFENESEEKSLTDFLAHVSLVSDVDTMDENSEYVALMTLHSAKGLEFPVVFLVGMEEGIFPGYRSMTNESELEEERRLCYVGITRAKENLYMTSTFSRTLFGNTTYNRVSRFVKEIPEELFDFGGDKKKAKDENIGEGTAKKSGTLNKDFNSSKSFNAVSFKPVQRTETSKTELKVGDVKVFGEGIITKREPDGDEESYANLTKVN